MVFENVRNKMKKYGYTYIIVATIILGGIFLPRLYHIITAKRVGSPFTLYSCILHDFASLDHSGKDLQFVDSEGVHYGDTVQPMFYYRDIMARGVMPDSIEGRKVTVSEIEKNYFMFFSDPDDVNKNLPKVYFLMESSPSRVDLDEAKHAFVSRKTHLDIIRMADNSLDKELSAAFTEALSDAGFVFPAEIVAGNPSTRKAYDEGYVMTDAHGELFHMKMVKGAPFVEHIAKPDSLTVTHAFITEYASRRTLAFITDEESRWYVVDSEKRIIPTDVVCNPASKDMMMTGDMFYITVKVSDMEGEDFWALRSEDFSTVATLHRDMEEY